MYSPSTLLQWFKQGFIYSLWAFTVQGGLKNRNSIACNYTISGTEIWITEMGETDRNLHK